MRLRAAGLVTAACLAGAGCGVPGAGTTQVPGTAVPYRLLDPAPPSSSSSSTPGGPPPGEGPSVPADDPAPTVDLAERRPTTYLVDASDLLQPFALEPDGAGDGSGSGQDLMAVTKRLERRLSAGPTPGQRDAGLSTALAPGVPVRLIDVTGDTARVALRQPDRDPAADRLPLAVGQVVLTLTSAPGVERVQFLGGGQPAAVPLPSGARSSQPVTAADYAALVAPAG